MRDSSLATKQIREQEVRDDMTLVSRAPARAGARANAKRGQTEPQKSLGNKLLNIQAKTDVLFKVPSSVQSTEPGKSI